MAISKVVVVDGNNLIVQIDRGVAGRGVTNVQPVEIDNSLYLVFTFSDGTTQTVGPVGTIQYIGQSPIVVTGSTISLSTVPVNLGGTGQTTANAGFNALAPSQTSNSGKYLKTDGTNTSWDLLDISTGDITGTLPVTNGGTGATTASGARTNLGLGTASTLNAGVALGVATLDAGGTVPLSQIPASIQGGVSYQGSWNASTNTPTLTSSVGSKGYYYVVSVAGSTNLNGVTDWLPGDWAIFNGTAWEKIDNTDAVASVNGYTGVVVLTAADVGAPPTARTISAGTGLSGGGDLSANRTISLANTAVTAGAYGSASKTLTATVNAQGQLTALSASDIAIANTQVSGLGTMSTQNANSVSITGGSVTGITDLAIADGGTGQSTAAAAITALTGTQVAGRYLRSDGTNAALSAIQAADVPTLNQNTTGTAAGLSATLAIASGGTGQTTANAAFNALAPSQTGNSGKYLTTDGSNTSWATNPLGTVTSVDVSGGTTGLTTSGGPITTSGTITLAGTLATANGGTGLTSFTANGVVYASSTSALATGSALTFDGTNLNVGIGGVGKVQIGTASSGTFQTALYASNGVDTDFQVRFKTGVSEFGTSTATPLAFSIGAAEQMRLTSTGLGIGTSSPSYKLSVSANTADGTTGYAASFYASKGAAGDSFLLIGGKRSDSLGSGVLTILDARSGFGNGTFGFYTEGTERMRLDSAGNLGLATTPKSWGVNFNALQVNLACVVNDNNTGNALYGTNFYYTGSGTGTAKHIAGTYAAALFSANLDGSFNWKTGSSGAADSDITFTQAMTLDASGNLALGTSSPQAKLQVAGASNATVLKVSSTDQASGTLSLGDGGSTTNNVGVYRGQPAALSNGNWLNLGGYDGIAFTTGNAALGSQSERARIDSSGNLLVGTTSALGKFTVANGTAVQYTGVWQNNNVGLQYFHSFDYSGTQIGSISGNNTLTLYNTTSDYRLKTVIGPVADSGSRIDALQPIEYTWKSDGSRTRGFLAHQFQEIYAGSVSGTKDAVDADGKPVYQAMQASSSEVIADLVAEIQSLRKRLADAGI